LWVEKPGKIIMFHPARFIGVGRVSHPGTVVFHMDYRTGNQNKILLWNKLQCALFGRD